MSFRLLFTSVNLLTVPRFSSIDGKNSIAHRGPVLWNILISKDKHFSNTSDKNLKRKFRSKDIFKELTFKETSTTTTNFRHKDFNHIKGFQNFFFNVAYTQLNHSFCNLTFRQFDFILLCIYFVLRVSIYARPHKLHSF